MNLDEYQQAAEATDVRPDPSDPAFPLLGLAGEVGSLVTEYKKALRSGSYRGYEEEVAEDLGDLLWYAAALATTLNLSLEGIAAANLDKAKLAWGGELPPVPAYDADYPESERLPRKFEITFVADDEREGVHRVRMYLGKDAFGDPLDDNAYEEDNYRFHDALHLAHAAVLGWSPLTRSLLKRKRKSDPDVDRVEDGGRAIALEEGLTAFVFSVAEAQDFFADVERIDWDLLKTVRRMTRHLEVADQPPSSWQRAILQGYVAWRQLGEAGGGTVAADLDSRTLTFLGEGGDV